VCVFVCVCARARVCVTYRVLLLPLSRHRHRFSDRDVDVLVLGLVADEAGLSLHHHLAGRVSYCQLHVLKRELLQLLVVHHHPADKE